MSRGSSSGPAWVAAWQHSPTPKRAAPMTPKRQRDERAILRTTMLSYNRVLSDAGDSESVRRADNLAALQVVVPDEAARDHFFFHVQEVVGVRQVGADPWRVLRHDPLGSVRCAQRGKPLAELFQEEDFCLQGVAQVMGHGLIKRVPE